MAVFLLRSAHYAKVDSRYIDTVDLTITNYGDKVVDVLSELSNARGVLYFGLFEAVPRSIQFKPNLPTGSDAFKLLIVTNLNSHRATGVSINGKRQGEDCNRLD